MKIWIWILLCASCFTFVLSGYKLYLVFTHPLKFKQEIVFFAHENNLDPGLVASVINVESSFREDAHSHKNAIGLMQIKLSTANYLNNLTSQAEINETDLFNPSTNINYGCAYLKYLIMKFENIETSLAAYNAGETKVRNWLKSGIYSMDGKTLNYIPYEETRNYVKKINENMVFYSKIFELKK